MAENILIVGNGFDLSHYLPTKYDHFMDVMDAIGSSTSDVMSFDDLFAKCREDWFIAKTKEYYKTEDIFLNTEQLNVIRKLLKENCWYQYFKSHVQEIKTWIDFEQKIEVAIKLISKIFINIDHKYAENGYLVAQVKLLKKRDKQEVTKEICVSELDLRLLTVLKLFNKNNNYGKSQSITIGQYRTSFSDAHSGFISEDWFSVENDLMYGISKERYVQFLLNQLDNFIRIFDLYLDLVVAELLPKTMFNIYSKNWIEPEKIFSFNYTKTYQRLYKSIEVEYLHGSHGEYQNIVLGVSDLQDESLIELKAYGFTKYHQKLFKDTDYSFLDNLKEKVNANRRKIEYFEKDFVNSHPTARKLERQKIMEEESKLDLSIQIWGHSLDLSDQEYIQDIFSLNDEIDRNVRVVVYYFNNSAKFSLLNNLLAILGKDKVEKWMKKKWLQFQPNPQIDFGVEQQKQIA